MLFIRALKRCISSRFKIGWRRHSNLSYIHHIGKEPLRALTLGKLLELTANKYPDREVFVARHQNQRLTYQDFLRQTDKLAAGLRFLGLENGDRVGLWSPNLVEWHVINIACARANLVVVAINPAYQASEMEYCINKVGIKAIVCPNKIKNLNFYDILNQVVPELKQCEPGKLQCHKVPSLKSVIVVSDEVLKGTFNYNEVMQLATKNSIRKIKENQHLIQPDAPINIQFTSGTTGKPKAVILSHFNVVNNSFAVGKRIELDQKHHKICVQVPFFHAFGYTNTFGAALNFGATMVIPSPTYNPLKNLEALKEERYKSVYGLTETTAVAFHSLPIKEDEYKSTATVGYIADHLEAKVVDKDGKMVPIGTPGELYIRGYATMLGYWKDEAKTKETIGDDKWLRTGDQFILQEDGYGRIVGRLKDMIIRGGENIYPKEIEDFLNTHPDILEAQVIGLSHERLGEEICACVRLKKGSQLTKQALIEFCSGRIANFKIPSQLKVVDAFPKTQSGKIQKHLLRKRFEEIK